uniref:microtubule-severing ATPase n=1 Tax=Palpitomonas bilix TaxID=652834 RepID=A0A7S3G3Q6_9EUKA|mmetsp:Transcript_23721/g.59820  ORF Transcript_23721/g.59820 Transcript_23721/m.59820 type:complete len:456 (+) Transcript_23721:117-1484(+)
MGTVVDMSKVNTTVIKQAALKYLKEGIDLDERGQSEKAREKYRLAIEKLDIGISILSRKKDRTAEDEKLLQSQRHFHDEASERVKALMKKAPIAAASKTPIPIGAAQPKRTIRSVLGGLCRKLFGLTTSPPAAKLSEGQPERPAAMHALKSPKGSGGVAGVKKPPTPVNLNAMKGVDKKLALRICDDALDAAPGVRWNDIAGLEGAKKHLHEAVILPRLKPDIFQGLRAPPKGILLFGPPGTGKTLLAKAVATEANARFFAISASSLTSKWVGEGEKLVRALFAVAYSVQPSIVFIDEIDSILTARTEGENEASRRLKTEFLTQFDGVSSSSGHVLFMGATNRPQEIDDAALRRFTKRVYIPLPDDAARASLVSHLLKGQCHSVKGAELRSVVSFTTGYSGSDLAALCKEAAMGPVREAGANIAHVSAKDLRPIAAKDFKAALRVVRPSVPAASW